MDTKVISLFAFGETEYTTSLLEFFFAEEYNSLSQKRAQGELELFEYQNFSKLPLLLSHQLFHTFDKNKNGFLSKDNYIRNLMTIYTGSIESRTALLFAFLKASDQESIHKDDLAVLCRHLFVSILNAEDLKVYGIQFIDDMIEAFFRRTTDGSKCSKEEFEGIIKNEDSSLFFLFYYVMHFYKTFTMEVLDYLRVQINISETNRKRAKTTLNVLGIFKGRNDLRTFSDYKTFQNAHFQEEGNWTFQTFIEKASSYVTPPNQITLGFFDYLIDREREVSREEEKDSFSELDELVLFESDVISSKSNFDEERTKRKNTLSSLSGLIPFESKESLPSTGVNLSQKEHDFRKGSDSFPISPNSKVGLAFDNDVSLFNLSSSEEKKYPKNKEYSSYFNEDEIMVLKGNCYHKYKIALIGSVLFILKWNKKTSQYIYNKIISIRQLYIKEANTVCTNEGYHPVELISLLYSPHKEFDLCFLSQDAKTRFIQYIEEVNHHRKIEDYYILDKEIGKGHFSKVFLGTNRLTSEKVAIKVINRLRDVKEIDIMKWELDLSRFLQVCPNDNVVKINDIFKTISNVYIVMEYFEIGSLTAYLLRSETCLPSHTVFSILTQMISALKYFEHFGIIHRDIKTDNILTHCSPSKNSNGIITKITDFGLAQMTLPSVKRKENYGTLLFTAPEILLGIEYDSKVDMWSLGVLLYYLAFTFLPFNIKSHLPQREISNSVISNSLVIPKRYDPDEKNDKAQSKISNFLQLALQKDWRSRPKISTIHLESID